MAVMMPRNRDPVARGSICSWLLRQFHVIVRKRVGLGSHWGRYGLRLRPPSTNQEQIGCKLLLLLVVLHCDKTLLSSQGMRCVSDQ